MPPEVEGETPAACRQTLVELFRVPLMTKVHSVFLWALWTGLLGCGEGRGGGGWGEDWQPPLLDVVRKVVAVVDAVFSSTDRFCLCAAVRLSWVAIGCIGASLFSLSLAVPPFLLHPVPPLSPHPQPYPMHAHANVL